MAPMGPAQEWPSARATVTPDSDVALGTGAPGYGGLFWTHHGGFIWLHLADQLAL